MRFLYGIAIAVFFILISFSKSNAESSKYVQIKSAFANIYEFLDPKSSVIKQAKKGDHLELIYEGTSWYQVKASEKVGWLEKRAGDVVDNPNYLFSPLSIGLFLILLAGTFGGVVYYINKQKTVEV